ncbi:hypothetical protein TIFTF001_022852 [Ficus carica]|uniref:LOB domain-containing protein n=1 Tax=Ficus carica TaxID=3494 RepID=A0AA88DK27_FICCA|nr:hypothetical protein TIFTF001_022852 [Ficus carica]
MNSNSPRKKENYHFHPGISDVANCEQVLELGSNPSGNESNILSTQPRMFNDLREVSSCRFHCLFWATSLQQFPISSPFRLEAVLLLGNASISGQFNILISERDGRSLCMCSGGDLKFLQSPMNNGWEVPTGVCACAVLSARLAAEVCESAQGVWSLQRDEAFERAAPQREDAVNSLAYEADMHLRDHVYGCVGIISLLQHQLRRFQMDLTCAKLEASKYQSLGLITAAHHHHHQQNVGITHQQRRRRRSRGRQGPPPRRGPLPVLPKGSGGGSSSGSCSTNVQEYF